VCVETWCAWEGEGLEMLCWEQHRMISFIHSCTSLGLWCGVQAFVFWCGVTWCVVQAACPRVVC
jgi:hypothetical protein